MDELVVVDVEFDDVAADLRRDVDDPARGVGVVGALLAARGQVKVGAAADEEQDDCDQANPDERPRAGAFLLLVTLLRFGFFLVVGIVLVVLVLVGLLLAALVVQRLLIALSHA